MFRFSWRFIEFFWSFLYLAFYLTYFSLSPAVCQVAVSASPSGPTPVSLKLTISPQQAVLALTKKQLQKCYKKKVGFRHIQIWFHHSGTLKCGWAENNMVESMWDKPTNYSLFMQILLMLLEMNTGPQLKYK